MEKLRGGIKIETQLNSLIQKKLPKLTHIKVNILSGLIIWDVEKTGTSGVDMGSGGGF